MRAAVWTARRSGRMLAGNGHGARNHATSARPRLDSSPRVVLVNVFDDKETSRYVLELKCSEEDDRIFA